MKKFFDPHIHMSSRTTDDYRSMKDQGIVAVIEPAFWNGQPRTGASTFKDYFSSLIGWERFRASQFGIKHYCAISINPKEANNEELAEEVMHFLPIFARKEGVVAIGEIGFDDITKAEERFLRLQIDLAIELKKPIMIHTPHRNKKEGTGRTMDICREHNIDPSLVIMDHVVEPTIEEVLNRGYWAAFSIYPGSKMTESRMANIVNVYGYNKLIVNSAADWGISDPLAVPKTAKHMLEHGISKEAVNAVCYGNAIKAYGQSGQLKESDWDQTPVDQTKLFEGNSVLRGQEPRVEP